MKNFSPSNKNNKNNNINISILRNKLLISQFEKRIDTIIPEKISSRRSKSKSDQENSPKNKSKIPIKI